MNPVRLMLVDDHALVRRGLAALLNTDKRWTVVAEAGDGEQALGLLESAKPDVVILDLSMPRMNGLETLRRLKKSSREVKVLILSMYDDGQFAGEALRSGADGYMLKHDLEDELFLALERVTAGETYLCSHLVRTGVEIGAAPTAELTAREREVLQLIVDGKTTHQVARVLHISPHTATRHRANLMQKLGVHSQVELVRRAVELGLVLLPKSIDLGG